jgi:hypothetical protein
MSGLQAALSDLPIAAWVMVLAVGLFIVEYGVLRFRQRRSQPEARRSEHRLNRCAEALHRYAERHGGLLPDRLDELGLSETDGIVFRAVPRFDTDRRLILVYDAEPTHQVLEFPRLRAGRAVVFCTGRMVVVTEEAFEKLLRADDALRGEIELPVAEPSGRAAGRGRPGDPD